MLFHFVVFIFICVLIISPTSVESTTPEGSPPPGLATTYYGAQTTAPPQPTAAAPNTSSILEALANMARQNTTAAVAAPSVPAPAPAAVQDNLYNIPPAASNGTHAPHVAPSNPPYTLLPTTQPVNVPPAPAAGPFGNFPSNPNVPIGAAAPSAPPVAMNAELQRQILLLKTLADAGVPQDQWGGIIAALTQTQAATPAVGNGVNAGLPGPQYGAGAAFGSGAGAAAAQQVAQPWTSRPDESRDHIGRDEIRSPQGRYRRRSRSPSPARGWKARDSPVSRRRDEPHYGDHGRISPGYDVHEEHVRSRQHDYRQRSPIRRGRSPSPPRGFYDGRSGGEKWVDFDPTIPKGSIKGM